MSDSERIQVRALGRRVLRRFAAHKAGFALSLLTVVLSTGLGIAGPLFLRVIVDEAVPQRDRALLMWMCLGMLAVGIAQSGFFYLQSRLTNSIGLGVVHGLRVDVYQRVQSMPITFHAGRSGSEVQTRLASDIGGISDVITFTAQHALGSLTMVVTIGTAMLILSWPIAVVAIGLTLGLVIMNQRYAERQRLLAVEAQEHTSEMMRLAGEHLSLPGVLMGRTMRCWDGQRDRFRASSAAITDLTIRERSMATSAESIIGVSFAVIPPVVYWMAGGGFTSLSIGTAIVLVVLQLQLAQPIRALLGLSTSVRRSLAHFDRIFEYIDLGPTAALPAPRGPDTGTRVPAAGITLREVSYRYPESGRSTLRGIDLDFPAGSTTMIVGSTGSGKSTLGYLVAGLLEPGAGTVRVSGGEEKPSETVLLVPQEPGIFNATFRENLLLARPGATEAELREVLFRLALDDLVSSFPEGLDTSVGERGYQLSGGERQRLGLARALLSDAPVVVLDEVTSALDWATARTVQAALEELRGNRTMIVISHRLSGAKDTDRVVVLAEGLVAEEGTHGELRTAPGRYSDLLRMRDEDLSEAGKAP
ncbi:ABC transporter ATP-binding protein [Streptomyces albipurpureus]|uniref:ABC transporter ATP-binding protein/permease n=1 Tax=Streptomyces albipurpureus TaxID=2897419 RepID=A0ABT0UF58_9ACTN|nr:ABC transporter ATP-binding protein [Streptomyces sp. CWNU-1]MCM2386736.1 ABC transporter ATP-binding protein/permease [Streptomyces sp. CWNU-1]